MTKEEAFYKAIDGYQIVDKLHYKYLIKGPKKEYLGDIDTELGTMYISFKLWSLFIETPQPMSQEDLKSFNLNMINLLGTKIEPFNMTYTETLDFFKTMMLTIGYDIKPY